MATIKKAQNGASMEDPLERKLPKRKGVLPSMTRVEKDTTANSTRRQLLDGFQKGPSPSKRKYKNGGAAPKAQFGKMIKSGLGKLSSEAKAIKSGIKEGMTQGVQSYRKNKFFNEMDRLKGIGKVAKMPKGMGFKSGGKVSKMKNGGSLSALSASNKRDNGIDPKGAFTKVQKKTLAGAKGKAKLTQDKQLGATKMAKRGMSMKKK